MFLDPTTTPEVWQLHRIVAPRWQELRVYAQAMLGDFTTWPEPLHNGGWKTFALKWQREVLEPVYPWLFRRSVRNAGFSLLQPGTEIEPHYGYTDEVLRYHLGLSCPDGCAIEVNGHVRAWADGEALLFDDTLRHSAWNRSDQPRLILLVDIDRKAVGAG